MTFWAFESGWQTFFSAHKNYHPFPLHHLLHMTAADASSFSYSDSLLRVELTEIYWKQWVPRKSEQNEDLSIFSFNFQTVVLLLPRDQPGEKSRPSRGECSVLDTRVQCWTIHTVYNTYFENDTWSLAKLVTSSNCWSFFFLLWRSDRSSRREIERENVESESEFFWDFFSLSKIYRV